MSQPISESHGVKFFESADSCILHFENTPWVQKALSIILSFGTLLAHAFYKISLSLRGVDAQMESLTKINEPTKTRLVVCIHGLNSNPSQFEKIINELPKDFAETEIFIPRVLQKGNAKLDEMVTPIFDEIAKWANTPGEKELVLVGISNGGRISQAIEAEMAITESWGNITKFRFISIVGACRGSSLVNLAKKVGLSTWVMSKNISEEMATDSERIKRLNLEWVNGLSKGPAREYIFIASPHDWQVTNYDSTLMAIDSSLMGADRHSARYAIVHGHGHNSIVTAVAKSVAQIIVT